MVSFILIFNAITVILWTIFIIFPRGIAIYPFDTNLHVTFAWLLLIFMVFGRVFVIFFFVGTGKMMKEKAETMGRDFYAEVTAEIKYYKKKLFPFEGNIMLFTVGMSPLAGYTLTGDVPLWLHVALAGLILALGGWALTKEFRFFVFNNLLAVRIRDKA